MVFADWTVTDTAGASGTASLDGIVKYAGNSSCKMYINEAAFVDYSTYLTHNFFSQPQAQVEFWIYSASQYPEHTPYIRHVSYGYVPISYLYRTASTWEKFRVTFWYDLTTNTKFGRLEKWVSGAWVQQGSDTGFGTGSPTAGTIALRVRNAYEPNYTFTCWFDEVEVYS